MMKRKEAAVILALEETENKRGRWRVSIEQLAAPDGALSIW
jgi:hypothetical protein